MNNALSRKLSVFLCYTREDKQPVRELWNRLTKESWVDVWLDEENLIPGENFRYAIQKAIEKADIVMFFLSSRSAKKEGFIQREFNYALEVAYEKPKESIYIIPVIIEQGCEIPYEVRDWHWLEYYSEETRAGAYNKLLNSFEKRIKELKEKGDVRVEISRVSSITSFTNSQKDINIHIKRELNANINVEQSKKLFEATRSYGWATCKNPGLMIFIVDVSESMGKSKRINLATDLFQRTIRNLISLSQDNKKIYPTYRIAIYAYADNVIPLYENDWVTLDDAAKIGPPHFSIMKESTDTAKAFAYVLSLLKSELTKLNDSPAPIIYHITDGNYTENDPTPYAREIMSMRTNYGHTLLQNIFLANDMLVEPIQKIKFKEWTGIKYKKELYHVYARKLFDWSSKIPEKYLGRLKEAGYSSIRPNSRLLFPGEAIDIASRIYALPSYLIDCMK